VQRYEEKPKEQITKLFLPPKNPLSFTPSPYHLQTKGRFRKLKGRKKKFKRRFRRAKGRLRKGAWGFVFVFRFSRGGKKAKKTYLCRGFR